MSPKPANDALRAAIARLDPVQLAARLVRLPSHPGLARQEEAAARQLAAWLGEHGVAAELDEAAPGRPNVVARVAGARPGPTLLLCGHTDTVPLNAGDPGYGFSGELAGGWLRGRGAVDMKGPLAAMAAALVVLRERLPAGEVVLAAVVDEEMESIGAERLIARGLRADGAVVGEPTSNRLALGHKGLEWLEVEFVGRAAHGGTPEAGVNAVVAASRFVAAVGERLSPRLATRRHPLIGAPTLNFGTITGGDQPSTVAARCRLTLDRRTVPGERFESVLGELEELLAEIAAVMPGLTTRVGRVAGGMATLEHVALATAPETPIARAAARAVAALRGVAEGPIAFPAWTDGALLAEFAGIPTVVLGPGDLAFAHSRREAIPAAEIDDAAWLYAHLALEFCAGEPASP
ncbi:MAG: M20/M25/M40 family metallo-hydrolase [Thermoanaerobaculia bacterium]|nr:M20/M25/M40 family metallo-hydrolase [Thermoanaerobaculia bacterium]